MTVARQCLSYYDPNKLLTLYAIVDDQSNCTLAKSELLFYAYTEIYGLHCHHVPVGSR